MKWVQISVAKKNIERLFNAKERLELRSVYDETVI